MKLPNLQILLEQLALLFASLVWTVVVLAGVAMFWVYQDVQARWNFVLHAPPEALAQAIPTVATSTPIPTPTLWPGPPPTLTPTATKPPTPTSTRVIQPPNVLPETLNQDEPTPAPVVLPTDAVAAPGLEQPTPLPVPPTETPVPTLVILPQPVPDTPAPTPTAPATPIPPAPEPPAPEPSAPEPPPPAPANPSTNGDEPARLVISSVGIDTPVIPVGWQVVEQNGQQYSIWQVADFAVGWHKTSARLGQPGNTVMAGHHNINGEVFRDLVNVEVGDAVTIYTDSGQYQYRVDLKTIVKEKGEPVEVRQRNAQWIAPTTDERVTLVTCWPYTNNTHRVIVVLKRT